jgi:hypothetical protein
MIITNVDSSNRQVNIRAQRDDDVAAYAMRTDEFMRELKNREILRVPKVHKVVELPPVNFELDLRDRILVGDKWEIDGKECTITGLAVGLFNRAENSNPSFMFRFDDGSKMALNDSGLRSYMILVKERIYFTQVRDYIYTWSVK